MNKGKVIIGVAAAGIAFAAIWTFAGPKPPQPDASKATSSAQVKIPSAFSANAKKGEAAFNAVCATCHGKNASGTNFGPPLIHKIYEPSHHADMAFELAMTNGVRAHHWRFGNMPPQPSVTPADRAAIIAYVRELQRENGIF